MLWLIYARTWPFLSVFWMNHRGPESWGASSEAIHLHHCRRRGHFRRGGSTKGGLCLGAFVGNRDFLVAFGHALEKARKNWRKICFLFFYNPFHRKLKAKTGHISQNERNTNWFKLSFTLCYPFHPSTWGLIRWPESWGICTSHPQCFLARSILSGGIYLFCWPFSEFRNRSRKMDLEGHECCVSCGCDRNSWGSPF